VPTDGGGADVAEAEPLPAAAGTRQSLATPRTVWELPSRGIAHPDRGFGEEAGKEDASANEMFEARRSSRRPPSPLVTGGVTSVTPRRWRRSASAASAARQLWSDTVNPSRPAVDSA
jgi:hypothetical protein